jgi:glycosyltransferase involved in cell wall biosynthesis
MACGTPVIAYRRGSMAEVVDVGVTGYLADDLESAVLAIDDAVALDRMAVHARAADRFGAARMVSQYCDVYAGMLAEL